MVNKTHETPRNQPFYTCAHTRAHVREFSLAVSRVSCFLKCPEMKALRQKQRDVTETPTPGFGPKVGHHMEATLKLRSKLYRNTADRERGLRLVSCVDDGHGHLIIPNCPYCGADHWHGANPGDIRRDRGPRVPHCGAGESAGGEYRLWCAYRAR